jgi:hypothetical protein
MSPRKIFEESEDAEMRSHTGRSSIQDGVRPQRQRSASSARKKRTTSVTPQEAVDKGGGTSSGEELSVQSAQAVTAVKENQIILDQGILTRLSVESSVRRDSESDSAMEMMTVEDLVIQHEMSKEKNWKINDTTNEEMEITESVLKSNNEKSEKSRPANAKPLEQPIPQLVSISVGGSSDLSEKKSQILQISSHLPCKPSEETSNSQPNPETVHDSLLISASQDLGVIPSVVIAAEDMAQKKETPDSKSGISSTPIISASISVPINILPTLSSSGSASSSTQLGFLQKEPQNIPKTSVSNRSAFVPFSQFIRKDNSGDEPDFLSDPDENPCLPDKAQTIFITENGKQFIIMTPKSNILNLPSNVDPKDSQIPLVPATASSNPPPTPVKTTTTPAQVEPQSPTTPKKNRSRFTPIRPKGSPAKTVSSILKEQKLPEKADAEKIDRSKSVSTLLKEKREREAKLQTSVSSAVPVPQVAASVASMGALATIPATKLPLQNAESQHGEYFIILNPVTPGINTPIVSMTSESVTSVTTTLTTVSSHGAVECSSSTTDLGQRQERSRTASFSEGEIMSPSNVDNLNISDLSDSSDEKPSKLAKIVDSEQNVSSRPGSRCSMDRETPSILGRKRKLFSSQSAEGSNLSERHPPRVPSTEEDVDFTMEEDRRAVSCSLDYKDRCSQRDVSRVFDAKLKLAEKKMYPDISILESDALQDACIPDPSNFMLSGKELCKQKQDTGVGVTSLSLRKSQQRLLKEKPLLDERMKSFFQQNDAVLAGKGPESQDSELPPDVAEFITDSMTQAHLGEQMEVTHTMLPTKARSLSRQEVVQEICKNLQNIPCSPSVLPPAVSPVNHPRSHSAKNLPPSAVPRTERVSVDEETFRMPYRSRSVTDASRVLFDSQVPTSDKASYQQSQKDVSHQSTKKPSAGVEFASPQRPIRRQRTPSTENKKRESSMERSVIPRESSVERSLIQTPHSDPGYGSVGPSPILQSVLVSTGSHVCDSTYSSMSSTSLSVCRPDSAHSVTSDGIIPSPMTSPRFQTSTPYHLKSPCVTPSQGPVSSEAVPVQSFMPIQGSSQKLDNSFVTLIRPVVTIASQMSQNVTVGQVFLDDGIGEPKPKSTKQAPPSYSATMQAMERKSKKENKQGAFTTLEAPLLSLADEDPLPGPPLKETLSGHSFYFSDKLAQLSKKTHVSESVKGQKKPCKRDESIKIIMGQLTSPIDPLPQGQANIQSLSELPDANYQGNQPNVNMFDIEEIVTYKNMEKELGLVTDISGISGGKESKEHEIQDQVQYTARRNLNDVLGQSFSGDDLQATLDDLKAVDGQYFVDNFDLGSEKRQEI